MHTQLLHGALLVVFSPPASPAGSLSALHLLSAQRGLGLLRRPPHMTCGELFIIEGAPWGSCSLRAGPARLSPVSYLPLTLPPRTTEKSADGVTLPRWGRPFSLLLEALKSSQQTAPPPRPGHTSPLVLWYQLLSLLGGAQGKWTTLGMWFHSSFIISVITGWL